MSEIYRDYGEIGGAGYTGSSRDTARYSQVHQATYSGENRLDYMRRSFISFSYGGKHIEDFDLIATISGDRWERDGYSTFDDITSQYDNLDGQYYWGTHYKTHTITFKLSTDGIDHRMVDEFLHWFSAGISRELILSEHPNRAQMARVAEPPQLSLLPFEGHTSFLINGEEHAVTTTLFKGDITLKLIMDEPHWYAIDNILGKQVEQEDPDTHQIRTRYIDWWLDANGQEVEIFASQDALKILYEDGIPLGSMIENNMLLGNKAYANVENHTEMLIWSEPEEQIVVEDGIITSGGVGARIDGTITQSDYILNSSIIAADFATEPTARQLTTESGEEIRFDLETVDGLNFSDWAPGTYIGIIAGAIVDVSGGGIASLPSDTAAYFFYAGTAPSPTIISFSINPTFNSQGYFTAIGNDYGAVTPNNYILIESTKQQKLVFTTPNLITSYNMAIKILDEDLLNGAPIQDVRDKIIRDIRHPAVREWVGALLSDESTANSINSSVIAEKMTAFFKQDDRDYAPMTFSFNSKTGEAIGQFTYRTPLKSMSLYDFVYATNAVNKINTLREQDSTLTDRKRYENLVTWGWSDYCIDSSNELVVPDPNDENSYSECMRAFFSYLDTCTDEGISIPTIFTANESVINLSNIVNAVEDVGDMLQSNNIIITERNYPNELGKIVRWQDTPQGRKYSHRLRHNLTVPLKNLQIVYKYMYL